VKFAKRDSGGNLPSGFTASLDDYFGVVAASAKLPDGTDDPDDQLPVRAHDQIAALGTGEFTAINFLTHPSDFESLDGATFAKDASGNIIAAPDQPTERIWATIALPATAMPATGFPVVIVQHGLASWRGYAFSLANTFCKNGWAVVAIDSYPFGSRAPEPEFQHDANTDYQSAPGAKYKGPDGIGDTSNNARNSAFDMFGGLKNLGALRDQLRQASLDTSQLVRMIRGNPDLSSLATSATTPKFDPTRIGYIGDSLGGIEGATAAAIEPNVGAWVLNVAGGGVLQELATHGPSVGFSLSAAAALDFGLTGDTFDEGHPLVVLGQTLIDAGDPLTFAKFLLTDPQVIGGAPSAPRNILQTEVIYDELVANESGEALARAAGYGLALPNVGSNAGVLDMKDLTKRAGPVPLQNIAPDSAGAIHDTPIAGKTAVVVQLSPATHGEDLVSSTAPRTWNAPFIHPFDMLDKSYRVRTSYRAVQAGAVQFFADEFSGKVPRVAGFTAPIRDVDDDGTPDDVDADPNNPSVH
jgi:dienelactone hydrolase